MPPPHKPVHRPSADEIAQRISTVDCRFKTPNMRSWGKGRFGGLNCRGEALITEAKTQNLRTIEQECVELASVGPRGGAVWVPLMAGGAE